MSEANAPTAAVLIMGDVRAALGLEDWRPSMAAT